MWPPYSNLVLAFVHFVAISAAALFVTRLAETNSLALLEAETCGTFGDPSQSTSFNETYRGPYETWAESYAQTRAKAFTYSVACHTFDGKQNQSISPKCINMGIVPPTWLVVQNVACPFSDHVCSEPALRLDSGLVDTLSDLGINTRPDDRLQYRTVRGSETVLLHALTHL